MLAIRLYSAGARGRLEDLHHELEASECGGVCPAPGDRIVASVDEAGGSIWEVRERYFKARGPTGHIVLVVEERRSTPDELDLL